MPQPQRETARLTKKLNLSADQSAKFEPILADRDQKITTLKNDTTITPMITQKQMHAIPPANNAAVRSCPHTRPDAATAQHAPRAQSRRAATASTHHPQAGS
jgi:hypothetical protein